jgi:hypothetical protein
MLARGSSVGHVTDGRRGPPSSHAEYLVWRDGLPSDLLGHDGEGADGAVMVELRRQPMGCLPQARERADPHLHSDVAAAYNDAVTWIWTICADEVDRSE